MNNSRKVFNVLLSAALITPTFVVPYVANAQVESESRYSGDLEVVLKALDFADSLKESNELNDNEKEAIQNFRTEFTNTYKDRLVDEVLVPAIRFTNDTKPEIKNNKEAIIDILANLTTYITAYQDISFVSIKNDIQSLENYGIYYENLLGFTNDVYNDLAGNSALTAENLNDKVIAAIETAYGNNGFSTYGISKDNLVTAINDSNKWLNDPSNTNADFVYGKTKLKEAFIDYITSLEDEGGQDTGSGDNSGSTVGSSGGGPASSNDQKTEVKTSDDGKSITVVNKPKTTNTVNPITGQPTATAKLDVEKVLEAIKDVKTATDIQVEVEDDADVANVEIKAHFVSTLSDNNKDNTITMVTKQGSTTVPAQELVKAIEGLKNLGIDVADANVNISFGKALLADEVLAKTEVTKEGANALTAAFVTSASVSVGDKQYPVKNFSSYVKSTVKLQQKVNKKQVVGVQWIKKEDSGKSVVKASSIDGELVAVPTIINVTDDGTEIIVKQRTSAPVMVIENNKTFTDLAPNYWAKNDIDVMASKMLVKGRSKDNFEPNGKVTRAEYATFVVRALGLTQETTGAFGDIDSNAWYAGTVGAAYKAGIISGMGDGKFAPNEKITREQAAAMVVNAMNFLEQKQVLTDSEGAVQLAKFKDASNIKEWAKESVILSAEAGVIGGDQNGNFNPQADATRAESVAMLKRLMKKLDLISE